MNEEKENEREREKTYFFFLKIKMYETKKLKKDEMAITFFLLLFILCII